MLQIAVTMCMHFLVVLQHVYVCGMDIHVCIHNIQNPICSYKMQPFVANISHITLHCPSSSSFVTHVTLVHVYSLLHCIQGNPRKGIVMAFNVFCCLWGHTESETTEVTQQQEQQHVKKLLSKYDIILLNTSVTFIQLLNVLFCIF